MRGKSKIITPILALCYFQVAAQEADNELLEPSVTAETLAEISAVSSRDADRQPESESGAFDEIELETTEISGNQSLPKVLYIVPWQKPEAGELVEKPVSTALDDVLEPIDRPAFIRRVDYYSDLYGERNE